MKVASLFSGIGGFEKAVLECGHDVVLSCEIWDHARKILRKNFGDLDIVDDVRSIKSLPSGVDLLVGGFPCQDLSQAGRVSGIDGEKSGLIKEVLRIVKNGGVDGVLLENVPFMLYLNGGEAMQLLVEEFERMGFRWAYRTINSLSYLPQRRDRVFFLASKGNFDPSDVLFRDNFVGADKETDFDKYLHGFYWTEGKRGLGWGVDCVPTIKNGSTIGIPSSPSYVDIDKRLKTLDVRDAERLQGFDEGWTECRDSEFKKAMRWSLIGNAVVPRVVRWILEGIDASSSYDGKYDGDVVVKWTKSARMKDGKRVSLNVGNMVSNENVGLKSFLKYEGKLLSERASRGFLNRLTSGSLRVEKEFVEIIERHISQCSC